MHDVAARRMGELLRAMKGRGARREGLAGTVDPLAPVPFERELLARAAEEGWSSIHPGVFGAVLQAAMDEDERHVRGAHYTPEAAIHAHVVRPSLVEPWRARIRAASTPDELLALRDALAKLRILDPACGSGNFLHVAYRALARLEQEILDAVRDRFSADAPSPGAVRTCQLFGIDTDPLAVALARVTLLLGERPSLEHAGPDIRCDDALFCDWPAADLILGNPPFQAKNKMQQAFGAAYMARLRARYPDVPGRADYCVYWFRRAHDALPPGGRAGLVGTNTIRENDARAGGLDHIVAHGGTITEAVSTMVWPGAAVVHVSVVNWIKGAHDGPRRLSWQAGDTLDSPWRDVVLDHIPASLSAAVDATRAASLAANTTAVACSQGQTHGHEGYLLSADEARAMCAADPKNAEVIFPYLVGEDLLGRRGGEPSRWVIDFQHRPARDAERYEQPFRRVVDVVLHDRQRAADAERARNAGLAGRGNRHHEGFLRSFWRLSYPRPALMRRLAALPRYIACSRVTKRPIFAFVSAAIHPSDAVTAFLLEDDYSFGILQSALHATWFKGRCSTFKGDWRYTSLSVFDSFPWPQDAGAKEVLAVAEAAVSLRTLRHDLSRRHDLALRPLYASMEKPGSHPLRDAHAALDAAVRDAYGLGAHREPLAFLLELNRACAAREAKGEAVVGPGVPPGVPTNGLVTTDAVEAPRLA